MSTKQKLAIATSATPKGLVGRPFVIWDKPEGHNEFLPNWHGVVTCDLGDGYYLLEFLSGMGDGPSQIFHVKDMVRETPRRAQGSFEFFESI